MPDNEELERNKTSNSVANQANQLAKKRVAQTINKAASNAIRAWLLPILPWILVVVLVLIVVAGIIMYFLSGVGLVFDSIKQTTDNFGHKVKSWWYGGEQYIVADQSIIDVADKLESMGYDLKGQGFLSESLTDDSPKVAEGIERKVDAENIGLDHSGIFRDEKGITNIKSDNIRQYLVSSNYMYTLYNTNNSRFGKSGFIKLFCDNGKVGNKGTLYTPENPIINVLKNILSLQFGFDGSTIQIDINTQEKTMEIANVEGIFWWKKVNTFKYSLDGWTGRYGMPLEFLLSVHLASMQPDLAYDLTTEFETNVNMLLHPVRSDIIGHISIDGADITSGSISEAEWNNRKNIKQMVPDPKNPGVKIPADAEGNPVEPNGYDTHDYGTVMSDLAKIDNSFNMYYPYIGDVTDHWFRNAYLTIDDYSLKYIKNDEEFEYRVGERWTDYETVTDENGNITYALYEVNPDGTLGKIYNGTAEQAKNENKTVSKKAKTETINAKKNDDEFIDGVWSAYDLEYNAVLISQTPVTPDVVADYDSLVYKKELSYEAITSEALRQVRDGERGETNSKIKKMLTQYSYYTYNGQRERADAIIEDKARVGEYQHEDASGNIIDGTEGDKRNQNIVGKFSINSESLSAFKILENMNTLDADEIYRDFKELIVELNYFDKEYFAGSATNVFHWPIPDCGTAGWPSREFEKIENIYGTLINSRTNLLNLKNLFLQYRQEETEPSEKELDAPTVPSQLTPKKFTTEDTNSPDGATKNSEGKNLVENGYATSEWEKQLEKEKQQMEELKKRTDDYVPPEKNKQQSEQKQDEGQQGKTEIRNAGGGGPVEEALITQDFIKAEDESGARGWYDTFDIVMDNMGLNYTNPSYGESEKSYLNFLQSLGGVFAEYAGDENNGEGTYEDFMAGCQYVYGLATMFGFQYCNGDSSKCNAYQHGIPGHYSSPESPNDAYHQEGIEDHRAWYGRGRRL